MSPATGVPWRPLVVITGVVLCLHAIALRGAPESLRWTHVRAPFLVTVHEPAMALAPLASQVPSPSTGPARTGPDHRPTVPARPSDAPAANADLTPPLLAVSIPASAIWRYVAIAQWRGMEVRGTAVLDWQHDAGSYEASLVLTAPPLQSRTQRSSGELADEGLRPLRFSDRMRTEEATHLDRVQGRITFSSNRPEVALEAGAQDRLSVLMQLMALVSANPGRFVPGASAALQVAGTRDADVWRFTVDGMEEVCLPGGTLRALKLTRAPRREYDPRLEVWLAPGQAYAPARLRLTPPNGDWLDLQWSGTDKR